ncbi:MAG: DUF368 domain-containing protein [Oscillospiraceae bacterium]|nr:DUF368 domain-containing protein [Oscillospiraceae bacterium]
MMNFIKGMITGMGGISPGFSGSILLVLFGLYEQTIEAVANIFKDFKKNTLFLFPIFFGMGIGFILFGTVVNYLFNHEVLEVYARYASLGLVLGTLPLFYREVTKRDFKKKYYIIMAVAFMVGMAILVWSYINVDEEYDLTDATYSAHTSEPTVVESMTMGFAVAGASIIPGINGSILLSAMGMYEDLTSALSITSFNLMVLIPVGLGVGIGVLVISFIMSKLLKKFYGITFSIIFGLYIAIITTKLSGHYLTEFSSEAVISIILVVVRSGINIYVRKAKKEKGRT